MKFGLPISIIFHALVALGGLLVWSGKVEPLANERIIPLELVTVSDMTNIAPTRIDDEDNPADVEADTIPDVLDVPDDPVDKFEPEKSKPEPAPVFDLDVLEKAFADVRQTNPNADKQQALVNEIQRTEIADKARRGEGAATDDTVNAKDYFRSRFKDCWYIDTGVPYFEQLYVIVLVNLKTDGSIANIEVMNEAEILASGSRYWKIAQENVLSGLRACAPYDGLLTIDYDIWKELRLRLDPGENE